MKCTKARQYLYAFLDNELDRALSLKMQQHIEHCPVCARECEIENTVRRKLADELQHASDPPSFDEPATRQLISADAAGLVGLRPLRIGLRKLALRIGIAAGLVIAAGLFASYVTQQSSPASLADALVDDFDHFVTENKPLQIVSGDASKVSDWLQDKTALRISMPNVDPAIATLMGGRKCKINEKPAAFAVYRVGTELVSVVALRMRDEALSRMKRVDQDGHTHWIDRCRGHTVLACRRGDLIYAVVSRLSEESLSSLMPPTEG